MIITSKGGGRPGMMPVGTHRVKIGRVQPMKGTPTIIVVFNGLEGDAVNTECPDFINLDTAEWRIRLIYEAATGDKYPSDGTSWDTADIINRECMIEVEHRENPNTGEDQARAARIYPIN